MIVSWPTKIQTGSLCFQMTQIGDFMAAAAEIVGATMPDSAAKDSVSYRPSLFENQEKCLRTYGSRNPLQVRLRYAVAIRN